MATSRRIGFVSTRFSGTDGVSLETQKWADVLERMGNQCFYFCGECDRPQEISHVVPEAFYRHPRIDAINQVVFTGEWGKIHEAVEPSDAASNLHQDFSRFSFAPGKSQRRSRSSGFCSKSSYIILPSDFHWKC